MPNLGYGPGAPPPAAARKPPLRMVTSLAAVALLVASIALLGAQPLAFLVLALAGLALLVINIVTIKKVHGALSWLLLLLTVPLFLWLCAEYAIFGLFYVLVPSGQYSPGSQAYIVQIPADYYARADTPSNWVVLSPKQVANPQVFPDVTNFNGRNVTIQIIPTKVPAGLSTPAQLQEFHNAVVAGLQKQPGKLVDQNLYKMPNEATVSEVVFVESPGSYDVGGDYFYADNHAHLSIILRHATSQADAEARFKQITDSIN